MIIRILLDSDLVFKLNEKLNLKGIFCSKKLYKGKIMTKGGAFLD
jgi:hypothetical protein